MKKFIPENEIYELLDAHKVKTPNWATINENREFRGFKFPLGKPVVVKGLAEGLWHKSDGGFLHFIDYDEKELCALDETMRNLAQGQYQWIRTLICEKVAFRQSSGLPCEGFFSIQDDPVCGMIITMGLGGIHTERWAKTLKAGIMQWPVKLTTPTQAIEDFKNHPMGEIWLGNVRQGKAFCDEHTIKAFLESLWDLADTLKQQNISLLEVNPLVVSQDGELLALDGAGQMETDAEFETLKVDYKVEHILKPKTVAIAGVSEKPGSFGKKIFENMLASRIANENLVVIKPKISEYNGIKAVPDVSALLKNPVDALILALPAPVTVDIVNKLCEQNGGAQVVYLVAGGIGDGADKQGLGDKLRGLLRQRRQKGLWTPALVGPNSLGIVLSELALNTLFIPGYKLPVNFKADGNLAVVSQSGAFFITRISSEPDLPVKHAFCVGNQLDLKCSDFLNAFGEDPSIELIATYVEGFDQNEAANFADCAKKLIDSGKPIILYKGGRSAEGMSAAAGHTGAMAGDYDLQSNLMRRAGVLVTESPAAFSACMRWYSAWPTNRAEKIAIISNAGFETVAAADFAADMPAGTGFFQLETTSRGKLQQVIEENSLTGLVSPNNPLDLTPMADEKAFFEAAKVFAESGVDTLLIGPIPLTARINSEDPAKSNDFAKALHDLALRTGCAIGVVIDSGSIFDSYKEAFASTGLPIFRSMEDAFAPLRISSKA